MNISVDHGNFLTEFREAFSNVPNLQNEIIKVILHLIVEGFRRMNFDEVDLSFVKSILENAFTVVDVRELSIGGAVSHPVNIAENLIGNIVQDSSHELDSRIRYLREKINNIMDHQLMRLTIKIISAVTKQDIMLYDARIRVMLINAAGILNICYSEFKNWETYYFELVSFTPAPTDPLLMELENSKRKDKIKRAAVIAGFTVGVGTLCGVTGGLAAPVFASYLGGLTVTNGVLASVVAGSSAILESTAGVVAVTTMYSGIGASYTGNSIRKMEGDLKDFKIIPLNSCQPSSSSSSCKSLTNKSNIKLSPVAIAVSGWISKYRSDEFKKPWKGLKVLDNQYYLEYEKECLFSLGEFFENWTSDLSRSIGMSGIRLAGAVAALKQMKRVIFPIEIGATVLDMAINPWTIALNRSARAGKRLAEELITNPNFKGRPVTLVGFSMGARVIFTCLMEMSSLRNYKGIVENVYLIGAACTASPEKWSRAISVVAGKMYNVYSKNDAILRRLFKIVPGGAAGIQAVKLVTWNEKLMNIDFSDVVNGHLDYSLKMDNILLYLGIGNQDT